MTFARALWADLVEKRLWPVAVALVIALVATPVALSKLGGDAPETEPPLPALPAVADVAPAEIPVTAATAVAASRPKGHYGDPFTGGPRGKSADSGRSSAPRPSGSSSSGASSDPTPASPSHSSSSGSASHAPAPAAPSSARPSSASSSDTATRAPATFPAGWRTDVAWGSSGHVDAKHDLKRLTVLRTRTRRVPGLVYLGVSEGHGVAYFAVVPGTQVSGDGRCVPSVDQCDAVALGKGDIASLQIPSDDGYASYALAVTSIKQRLARTRVEAAYDRILVSEGGQNLVMRLVANHEGYLPGLAYSVGKGVLREVDLGDGGSFKRPDGAPGIKELVGPGQ